MYFHLKTDRFLKLLEQKFTYPLMKPPVTGIMGVYMETLKDERVLLCATDGRVICVRTVLKAEVMQAITVAGYHVVKEQQGVELIYSHKKFCALDEKNGALLYPPWRSVLRGLKPLPAIPSSNDPTLRRYNLFDGEKLSRCNSLLGGKVWVPNYAVPFPLGVWAYVEDDFLLGCMPLDMHDCSSVEETRDYAALFPELQYIEKKAKKKSEGV